jgi:signal transduction histidine kinase
MRLLILFTGLLLSAITSVAQPFLVETDKDGSLMVSREGTTRVFIDSSGGKLPVEVVDSLMRNRYRILKNNVHVLKYNKAASWFSFDIENTSGKDANLVIGLGDPYLDKVSFYKKAGNSIRLADTAGALHPFGTRSVVDKNIAFVLTVPAHATVACLIRTKNVYHHTFMQLKIETVKSYEASLLKEYLSWGVATGILCFVMVFSLVIFFVEKNKEYLFFGCYVFSTIVWVWSNTGLGYQFIWSDYPQAMIRIRFMAAVGTIAAMMQSTQSFIGQHRSNSRFYNGMNITKVMLLLLAAVLLVPYTFNDDETLISRFIITGDVVIIMGIVLMVTSLMEKMKQGFRPALYYLVSMLILIVGTVLLVLARLNIISPTFLTLNGNYIGIMLQVLILAIGHIQRYQQYRREKEEAIVRMIRQEQETLLQVTLARENERNRIAADMHDELGAGISSLRLIGELAERKSSLQEIKHDVGRFTSSAMELAQKVKDIVWTLNPENDTLLNFVYYIHRYGQKLFEDTGIRFDMGIPPSIPHSVLQGDKRKHLLLVVKEAFTNVLKHSGADAVLVAIGFENAQLQIRIKDNGKGIDSRTATGGNGLRNMKMRMEVVGGSLHIGSENGTAVVLAIPIVS